MSDTGSTDAARNQPRAGAASTYETIRYELDDGVLTITLNRPDKLNALSVLMRHELVDALDRADADDAVKAVIFTGEGRAYCAGFDLSSGAAAFDPAKRSGVVGVGVGVGGASPPTEPGRDGGGILALRLFASTKPLIAAVNGAAVGIGASMLLPMDIRIASAQARFGFVFNRRGMVPDACASWFLPRVVGINRALQWTYTGALVGADDALAAGLVERVVPPDQLLAAARSIAREIADNTAPVSTALTRQMMWRMLGAAHPMQAHVIESQALASRGASADSREGVGAFLEKRPARFPGTVSADMPAFYPWWEEPRYAVPPYAVPPTGP
ncbi:MAG: enoyl-CoA hydratase [Rhizobacter sp.]|nr:enoyl-CoA hydratase [Rhizobacter sp.]